MPTAYINIGTNLGNRLHNIECAIVAIERKFNTTCRRSDIIESEPWGFSSNNKFMNIGIAFDTNLEPQQLLEHLQEIECSIGTNNHRKPDGTYDDRIIDIDIMAIGSIHISTPTLTIPHPCLLERTFFLTPMLQLVPDWQHPQL